MILYECHCISKAVWCLQWNVCHEALRSLKKVGLSLAAPHPCSFIMSFYLCEYRCHSCLCGILRLLLGPHRVSSAEHSRASDRWCDQETGMRGFLLELLSLERSGRRGQRSWRSGAVGWQKGFLWLKTEGIHNQAWLDIFLICLGAKKQ